MRPQVTGPAELPLANATRVLFQAKVLPFMKLNQPLNPCGIIAQITLVPNLRMKTLYVQQHRTLRRANLRAMLAFYDVLFYVVYLPHVDFNLVTAQELLAAQVAFVQLYMSVKPLLVFS